MAGIYLHIPFCKQACHYCNFYFSTSLANKERMLAALMREIELSSDYLQGETVETIYFGGGTPSLLSGDEVKRIVEHLHNFHKTELRELTLEANPDDLSQEKIAELKNTDINRFSIGVQSFFDEDLRYMNRAHNADEATACIQLAQDAGFDNLSVDLIYGTPTMSDELWQENMAKVFALGVPHLSSYALTVESKTSLEKRIAKGMSKPVDEVQAARQFQLLMQHTGINGFEHYEISNFAHHGRFALHNTNYWLGKKYLGLGPSAHSFDGKSRRWNVSNNIAYINSLDENKIPFEEEVLSPTQQLNEYVMTSLRTMWGCSLIYIEARFGHKESQRILQALQLHVRATHYVLHNNTIVLSDEGKFFADGISAALFA